MRMRRKLTTVAAALLLLAAVRAQQPNTAEASLIIAGVNGPPWPITVPINLALLGPAPALGMSIEGAPFMPFALAYHNTVIAPGLPIPGVGLLDLQLQGLGIGLDGIGLLPGTPDPSARTDGNGLFSLSVPVGAGTPTADLGLQAVVADPTNASGFRFTAATRIQLVFNPQWGFYASSTTGSNSNPGTSNAPFASIQMAINASAAQPLPTAFSPRPLVYVAQGTYYEAVQFRNAVHVYGGRDPQLWHELPFAYSIVETSGLGATMEGHVLYTVIRGLDIRAGTSPNNSGHGSIALQVRNCDSFYGGQHFERCRFVAGDGRHGAPGVQGAIGASGGNGGFGSDPINSGLGGGPGGYGNSTGGFAGGSGGPGATGAAYGHNGNAGSGGASGGAGGQDGGCGGIAGNGLNGGHGVNGTIGLHGYFGSNNGTIIAGAWSPAYGTAGSMGTAGHGGGGGGGGGGIQELAFFPSCVLPWGAGGGGGGASGGGGGQGGSPGQGGGCSFAVYTYNAAPQFLSCAFQSGVGGNGGNGGWGGQGGYGGTGVGGGGASYGWASGQTGTGGRGGDGGAGGTGGHGGGGAGGPSWCVYRAGTIRPVVFSSASFIVGVPGIGGFGGAGPISAFAPSGMSGQIY